MRKILLLLLPLMACTPTVENGHEIQQYTRDQFNTSKQAWQDLTSYHPKPKLLPKPVPPSYCYRVMQDILCYSEARAGWEDRLVAYQGSVPTEPAATVETTTTTTTIETTPLAPPPAPPPVESAPLSPGLAHWQASTAAAQPLKPVFIAPPPEVKADDSGTAPVK